MSALVVKTMVLVAVWCGFSSTAAAQSALTGIVHDQSSLVVVNAKVVVTDAVTGKSLPVAWTNNIGYYELEVTPGDYFIHVEQNGLVYDGMVRVYPNEKAALDITIKYFRTEQLTVPADDPGSSAMMTTQAGLGGTYTQDELNSLFLSNGRTLQSLAVLEPGMVATESNGTLAQYTAVGQQRFTNRLTVDGVSGDLAIDTRGGIGEAGSGVLPAVSTLGGTQTIVPFAAIEQVSVKTTSVTPEDARAPGAQMIVITRSGTDRFKGDGFFDWRPQRLGAGGWFATTQDVDTGEGYRKNPTSSQNGGLAAGGPIIPQQLRYFVAWEQQHIARPLTTTFQVPSLTARDAANANAKRLLAAFPVPNVPGDPTDSLGTYSGQYAATSNLSSVSLKLDATLSPSHRLFGRVNIGRSSGDWVNSLEQVPNVSFSRLESATTRTATVGLSSTRSALANEFRLNVSTGRGGNTASPLPGEKTALPLDLLLPPDEPGGLRGTGNSLVNLTTTAFGLAGFIQAGRSVDNVQTQVQFADTVTMSSARHDWRFGVDSRWSFASARPATTYTYKFGSIDRGQLRSLAVIDSAQVRAEFSNLSVFAEDTFRVSKRFSLTYGVRYGVEPAPSSRDDMHPYLLDVDTLPEQPTEITNRTSLWKTSWGSVAPRVAAAYQFGTGTGHETTLRGGWGIAFDSLNRFGADAFGSAYPYLTLRTMTGITFPVTQASWDLPAQEPFSPNDANIYYAFPKDFRVPRTYSWQVGLDQTLGRTQRLSVAYAGAAGRELAYKYFYIIGASRAYAYSNDGRSDYNALLTEYAWRPWRGLQVRANYTLSHAIDLDSGEKDITSLPNLPPSVIDPVSNRGSADFDRRHAFRTTASYQLPWFGESGILGVIGSDWQIDGTIALQSGTPVTVTWQRSVSEAFGGYPLRPDVVPGVPVWKSDASAPGGQILNLDAFALPATQTQQGTLGRNTLQAFPLRQLDLSLSRPIRLNQRVIARLRIDAFNILNLANFGPPASEATDPTAFGKPKQSYATALGTGTLTGGGLVPIQQTGGPRSLQVGISFSF